MSWKTSLLSLPKPWQIVFICSGNIMRSPYAEFLAKKIVEVYDTVIKSNLIFKSGAIIYQNDSISKITKNYLIQEGISENLIDKHIPRLIDNYTNYFTGNTFFIPMTNEQKNILIKKGYSHVFMINEIAKSTSEDILDPYFNPEKETQIFRDLKFSTKRIVEELFKIINSS